MRCGGVNIPGVEAPPQAEASFCSHTEVFRAAFSRVKSLSRYGSDSLFCTHLVWLRGDSTPNRRPVGRSEWEYLCNWRWAVVRGHCMNTQWVTWVHKDWIIHNHDGEKLRWKETSASTGEKRSRFKFWPGMFLLFIAKIMHFFVLFCESYHVLWSSAELQSVGKQLPVASSNDTFYRCHVLPLQERLHHSSVSKNVTSSSLRSSHHLMNSHTRSTPSSWLTSYLLPAPWRRQWPLKSNPRWDS